MVSKDYKREVTHTEYTFMNDAAKEVGIINKLDKEITENQWKTSKKEIKEGRIYKFLNQEYIEYKNAPYVIPIGGAGVFLFLFVGFLLNDITSGENFSFNNFLFLALFFVGFLFFAIYYFTMPKKETIFDRKNSLLTFPGFMWHKNITMSIHTVEFAFSQPSAQGQGAYELRIVRPDKMFSQAIMAFGGTCYEDLSLILWYMDKNRPLPPGDGFDEFRVQDYERRKSEGFPKPLFPARFDTPEATPEQQAERERIGGW